MFNLLHFKAIGLIQALDIALIIVLIYWIYKLIAGSTIIKMAIGLFIVYLFCLTVKLTRLKLLSMILGQLLELGPLISIVLFQREIRHFLFTLGKGLIAWKEIVGRMFSGVVDKKADFDVTPVVKAVQVLGGSNTGALIVFTKDSALRYYEASGDVINAEVSARLLIALFNKYSPLHDGAVIIHNNKIVAARCVLPVTENPNMNGHFGLRHKAAVGITEITDALVIVVSEESGQVSIARKGQIEINLSPQEIRSILKDYYA